MWFSLNDYHGMQVSSINIGAGSDAKRSPGGVKVTNLRQTTGSRKLLVLVTARE
jgi:hypothetical protein